MRKPWSDGAALPHNRGTTWLGIPLLGGSADVDEPVEAQAPFFLPLLSPPSSPSLPPPPPLHPQTSGDPTQTPVTAPLPWDHPVNERSNDGSPTSSAPRQRVRHSFDVFADQLLALREVALQREIHTGQHARLGDLVQEALDAFLAAARCRGGKATQSPANPAAGAEHAGDQAGNQAGNQTGGQAGDHTAESQELPWFPGNPRGTTGTIPSAPQGGDRPNG